jgi:hypothetical protein
MPIWGLYYSTGMAPGCFTGNPSLDGHTYSRYSHTLYLCLFCIVTVPVVPVLVLVHKMECWPNTVRRPPLMSTLVVPGTGSSMIVVGFYLAP